MTHNPLMSRERVVVPPRPAVSKREKSSAWNREGGICYWCGKPVAAAGAGVEYDHRLKRGVSADDSTENLYPLHTRCHREKTDGPDARLQSKVRGQEELTRAKEKSRRPVPKHVDPWGKNRGFSRRAP